MLSNYETNGVLKKVNTNQVAAGVAGSVASSVDLGQNELKNASSSLTASAYPIDTANLYPYNYLNKQDDRSDQENDEFYNSNDTNNNRYKSAAATSYPYVHNSNGGAIKRGCEVVDGENEDDFVTMSSSTSSTAGCSRRSPPKKPKFVVTSEEMNEFFKLLHHNKVQQFLKRDSCCLISDKYALAMVFTYFKRAKFNLQEYTLEHFYLALYLASDIEEDVDEYKYEIFPWALGSSWRSSFSGFLRKRDALLRRIGYRAIVSRKCCEEVMSFKSEHNAWKRERAEDHGGATRAYLINRSKRILSGKNDEEEMNYPRLAEEEPRPCPLCLINRGWQRDENKPDLFIDLQTFKPSTIILPQTSLVTSSRPKLADLTNKSNNMSIISVTDSSINETNLKINSPSKKTSFLAAKKLKPANQSTMSKSKSTLLTNATNNENLNTNTKSSKPISKTPKKSSTKFPTKFKHQQKQTEEIHANLLKMGAMDSTKDLYIKNRISSSNKISKNNKWSAIELENSNSAFDLRRRASLAATDKLLIKDKPSDEDDDDDSDYTYDEDDDDDDDENTDEVFANGSERLKCVNNSSNRKHDTLRSRRNASKICQVNPIHKRNNCSLSSIRNSTNKTYISNSTSSSKLELNMNSFERLQKTANNY